MQGDPFSRYIHQQQLEKKTPQEGPTTLSDRLCQYAKGKKGRRIRRVYYCCWNVGDCDGVAAADAEWIETTGWMRKKTRRAKPTQSPVLLLLHERTNKKHQTSTRDVRPAKSLCCVQSLQMVPSSPLFLSLPGTCLN